MILSCVIILLYWPLNKHGAKEPAENWTTKTQWKKYNQNSVRALDSMLNVYDVQTISK